MAGYADINKKGITNMANKMNFSEVVSFMDTLSDEEAAAGECAKALSPLGQGVYFLLDNSYILLLRGKVCKSQQ